MDYRTPLQHLLHKLLPVPAQPPAPAEDFEDTRPDDSHSQPPAAAVPARNRVPLGASPLDPFPGTEVMEYPDDAAAELLDEFFNQANKRAA
jgi:hypothetical protein